MGARSQRGARKKQVRGSPVHAAEASQTATGFVHGVASIAPWKGVADVDARRRKGCACIRLHPDRDSMPVSAAAKKDVLASDFTQIW